MDREAWQVTVQGVAEESDTTAKQITKETLQKFMEKPKDTSCQKLQFTTFGPKQIY